MFSSFFDKFRKKHLEPDDSKSSSPKPDSPVDIKLLKQLIDENGYEMFKRYGEE